MNKIFFWIKHNFVYNNLTEMVKKKDGKFRCEKVYTYRNKASVGPYTELPAKNGEKAGKYGW